VGKSPGDGRDVVHSCSGASLEREREERREGRRVQRADGRERIEKKRWRDDERIELTQTILSEDFLDQTGSIPGPVSNCSRGAARMSPLENRKRDRVSFERLFFSGSPAWEICRVEEAEGFRTHFAVVFAKDSIGSRSE